jgi:hypothetical protein
MRKMRILSESYMEDLIKEGGVLHPILERVRCDDTLMLAIRDNYINIYYRGGNILKIEEKDNGSYQSSFNDEYEKSGERILALPTTIRSQDDARTWIEEFPHLKEIMDIYFSINNKPEREFQQLVVRENNCSAISNETEYFVSDIEFADTSIGCADISRGARFDILAIRWLASNRQNGGNCRAALMEMKYGDGALGGKAGFLKHLQDIDAFISDSKKYKYWLETMESQFNQLDELGLLNYNHCSNGTKVKLDATKKPEVVFLLANHNPRSTKLSSILDAPEVLKYEKNNGFDLRFFVSQFAGYGLHSDCMLTLPQFKDLLKR